MKYKICIVFLWILSPNVFSYSALDEIQAVTTIYDQVEAADIVIDAVITGVETRKSVGGLPEAYELLTLNARVLGNEGMRTSDRPILLRIPLSDETDGYFKEGRRFVAFIVGNGEAYWPFVTRSGQGIASAVFTVTSTGEIQNSLTGKPVLGLDKAGNPIYGQKYNQCDLADVPADLYGAEHDSDDQIIREYTRAELLDQVSSFTCPDGKSQWVRGNDRPSDLAAPDPVLVSAFFSTLSKHRAALKLPDTELLDYYKEPSNKPLLTNNNLTLSKPNDELLRSVLNQMSAEEIEDLSKEMLVDYYDREILRGRLHTVPTHVSERVLKLKKLPIGDKQ